MTHSADYGVATRSWERANGTCQDSFESIECERRDDRPRRLDRAIQAEIVPRLLRVHSAAARSRHKSQNATSRKDAVYKFADFVLRHDVDEICGYVESQRARGQALDEIYLALIAPAASHLRYLWNTDAFDFAEVTLALWRLQQVLREFSSAFRNEVVCREHGLRVLLAPAPGERHEIAYAMFGLVLIAELFRREGWDAWIEPDTSNSEFAEVVANQWFDVADFLVCSDKRPDLLAAGIRHVRRASPNHSLGVIISGAPFINNPELVLRVGADCPAADPKQSVLQARSLVGSMAARC